VLEGLPVKRQFRTTLKSFKEDNIPVGEIQTHQRFETFTVGKVTFEKGPNHNVAI
jgi:hypothetical protein